MPNIGTWFYLCLRFLILNYFTNKFIFKVQRKINILIINSHTVNFGLELIHICICKYALCQGFDNYAMIKKSQGGDRQSPSRFVSFSLVGPSWSRHDSIQAYFGRSRWTRQRRCAAVGWRRQAELFVYSCFGSWSNDVTLQIYNFARCFSQQKYSSPATAVIPSIALRTKSSHKAICELWTWNVNLKRSNI